MGIWHCTHVALHTLLAYYTCCRHHQVCMSCLLGWHILIVCSPISTACYFESCSGQTHRRLLQLLQAVCGYLVRLLRLLQAVCGYLVRSHSNIIHVALCTCCLAVLPFSLHLTLCAVLPAHISSSQSPSCSAGHNLLSLWLVYLVATMLVAGPCWTSWRPPCPNTCCSADVPCGNVAPMYLALRVCHLVVSWKDPCSLCVLT